MTEAEQTLVALMLLKAEQNTDKKYKGRVVALRHVTEKEYKLERFSGAFENALEYLEEGGFAKIHRYEGVEDYVSIDLSGSTMTTLKIILPEYEAEGAEFSFEQKNPRHPVIATYFDVGGSWLQDFAHSLSQNDDKTDAVDSASWTGRFSVSTEQKMRIHISIREMRDEVEALELPNSEKSNALAAIKAIEALTDAPDPPWSLIVKILQSPILANLTALAALIITMVKG